MIVRVSLPIPVSKTFSYSVPHKLEPFIKPYIRVTVPFHNRILNGYIIGIDNENNESLKDINDLTDMFPLLNDSLIALSLWASKPVSSILYTNRMSILPALKSSTQSLRSSFVPISCRIRADDVA